MKKARASQLKETEPSKRAELLGRSVSLGNCNGGRCETNLSRLRGFLIQIKWGCVKKTRREPTCVVVLYKRLWEDTKCLIPAVVLWSQQFWPECRLPSFHPPTCAHKA